METNKNSNSPNDNALANEISDALLKNGLTQEDLAKRLAVTQASVSRWLSGSRPRPAILKMLSDILKVDLSQAPKRRNVSNSPLHSEGQGLTLEEWRGRALEMERRLEGLHSTLEQALKRFPLPHFGVSHTMQGAKGLSELGDQSDPTWDDNTDVVSVEGGEHIRAGASSKDGKPVQKSVSPARKGKAL
ncbi:putative transcriptional regulator [Opitutaceae bacterium TAV1]|nr:putative transcriptional regulator [Opitutaceae bacterium TAV1]